MSNNGGLTMLMFDEKLLIAVMAVLVLGMAIKLTTPQIQEVFGIDLILFFTGGLGLMTIFHMCGYIEGYTRGLRDGKTEMRKIQLE